MPARVTSVRAATPEDVVFLSSAVLNHLHLVLSRVDLPHAVLRNRRARRAAVARVGFSGPEGRSGKRSCAMWCIYCGPELTRTAR
ncbi:hypothetical protein [Sulfitobacter sp. PR48]|uniref:hypothetical protein n=1 Tax=Sulfitobacter sp. PR48 TaxID=3028383 RepID=UPI003FD2FD45